MQLLPGDPQRKGREQLVLPEGPWTPGLRLTGILSGIASTLKEAGISIFAVSTYDTDYILVKTDRLRKAKEALQAAGHSFTGP